MIAELNELSFILGPESGLYYFYHRYYHPANGRFLNEDPIGLQGGLNMYAFVNNNPVLYIDPLGLVQYEWKNLGHFGPATWRGSGSEGYNEIGLALQDPSTSQVARNVLISLKKCVKGEDGKWRPIFSLKMTVVTWLTSSFHRSHEKKHMLALMLLYKELIQKLEKLEEKGYDCERNCRIYAGYRAERLETYEPTHWPKSRSWPIHQIKWYFWYQEHKSGLD